jgi:arylamine N-acetyltransferase
MLDVEGFLERLGLREREPPSVAALERLHRAFIERISYEALDIQLGKLSSIDPIESVERIVRRRRGGYCFHLNGAFALLLRALGYQCTMHRAGVQKADQPARISRNHVALTVCGLSDSRESGWLVDVGLGDALHAPLPLRPGTYTQGPFSFRLRPSEIAPGGWRLDHDRCGSFVGMDFDPAPADMADFAERHRFLSTSQESGFVRVCVVQRRDATRVDCLRALTLSQLEPGHVSRTVLESQSEWRAALADLFGLTLEDLSPVDRDRLWRRATAQHIAHLSANGTSSGEDF